MAGNQKTGENGFYPYPACLLKNEGKFMSGSQNAALNPAFLPH